MNAEVSLVIPFLPTAASLLQNAYTVLDALSS
jgi:hypothetical protein